jgi:hypothetical protein
VYKSGEFVMLSKVIIGAAACLALSTAYANGGCDAPTSEQYRDCVRLVDSLRPDKAGQARVFAADGAEFTAGQARWMQGQLRRVERLCALGDQESAARILADVRNLLKAHSRNS